MKNNDLTPSEVTTAIADWPEEIISWLLFDWEVWARDDQLPPPDESTDGQSWRTWLVLGGRGAGKTRAGAEWVRAQALGRAPFAQQPCLRIALIGETMHDARSVMVEGVSGLMAVHPQAECPQFEPSKAQLVWPNGAIAQLFSAESPDSLRGPQFSAAWCDEVAKWRNPEMVWDMLQFALRLGATPRVVATTTPRPVPILRQLMQADTTVTTRSRTVDNSTNLSPAFIAEMQRRYSGTQLGRQELDGELIETLSGALWRQNWISEARVASAPDMLRTVVAVDPPVTSKSTSDACGIIVAGLGQDKRCYVLADRTIRGRAPNVWARAVVTAYCDFEADRVVAEVNQGGDLVMTIVRQVDTNIPITGVRATRGKWIRAEPVAALYAEGRIVHIGQLPELESQMLAFGPDGRVGGRSPDRVDALVWAVTDLMLADGHAPSARFV
ncbi:MAG: DNA-packaging protein [Hyphomicrobiaceae bacterium]